MQRCIYILMLMMMLCCPLRGMASFPIVRNFPRTAHDGGSQTWSMANDSIGRMYFGNKNGMLTYDSEQWQLHGINYGSSVRALYYEACTGRMYAGGSDEFGYFAFDTGTDSYRYYSLISLLPDNVKSFREIWNIFSLPGSNDVWFQADNYLFQYDGKSIKAFNTRDRITASGAINGQIYIATVHGGISQLNYGRLNALPPGSLPQTARVVELLPYLNKVLIVTEYDGLYTLERDRISPVSFGNDSYLHDSQVFCAAAKGDYYAFGTVSNGVMITNIRSGRNTFANNETGLQNNTVLSAYFDDDNRLWLGLDNGIDMIQVDLPYCNLLGSTSRYGTGYVSLRSGDELFLGTNQGLYVMPYSENPSPESPRLKQLIKGQIWSLKEIDGYIYASTDAGLYRGNGSGMSTVGNLPGCWYIDRVPDSPDYLLVSTYETFYLLQGRGSAVNVLGTVSGFNDIGGRFLFDSEGDLWITHWLKGVYRLKLDPHQRSFVSNQFFDQSCGLPPTRSVSLTMYDGNPVVVSDGGFSRLSSDGNKLVANQTLNRRFGTPVSPMVHQSPRGDAWIITADAVTVHYRNMSGETVSDSITFSPIVGQLIPGFEDFNFLNDGRLIVSMQDGFYDVNLDAEPTAVGGRGVYLRMVQAYGDSVRRVYPLESGRHELQLPFGMNSLRVEAVEPEFRGENAVLYSFRLENYDSDWSEFGPQSYKEYTQLPEGEYLMHVKSFNKFTRKTSEASFLLSIIPPWYRSTAAKIIYMLLMLVLLGVFYYGFKQASLRASRKMAARKELELESMRRKAREESLLKDYEIAELKSRHLENDVQHKTEELSNITMNVVRKNEILLDISERLDKLSKTELSRETARQISKIQTLIKENITRDDDWRNFIRTFDAAYGNFTKVLQERHPGLTPTELRVCCYLIMGLNSKEIAQLFNITHRSVEMTRYRLRKRLGLVRETSLTDYLNGIFADSKPEAVVLPRPEVAAEGEKSV